MTKPPAFAALKDKHRALRDGWPQPLSLRVHRALSWLGRAEREDDADIRFLLLWIGFNAAYSGHLGNDIGSPEQDAFRAYFRSLVELDRARRINDAIWNRFSQEVRLFLNNRFVFRRFWDFHNGDPAAADWEAELARESKRAGEAVLRSDTARVLGWLLPVFIDLMMDNPAKDWGPPRYPMVEDGGAARRPEAR